MKKLMKYGMIGAMVLGAQSMVFASSGVEKVDTLKATVVTESALTAVNEKIDGNEIGVSMVASVEARELTATEKEAMKVEEQVLAKEICEALNIQYDETITFGELIGSLTEAQMDALAEKGIIQVMTATRAAEAKSAE